MKLVRPSIEYKKSFLEALEEFAREEGRKRSPIDGMEKLYAGSKDFDEFLTKLLGYAEGKYLPEGYVPSSAYWLVEGERFVGSADIRHELTPHLREIGGNIGYAIRPSERNKGYGSKILELALQKAKELGIRNARITCDEDNIGSRKIIEKNGGVFDGTATTPEGVIKRRYWINND